MRRLFLASLLGLAHGVSDGAAGLLLGSLSLGLELREVGALSALYFLLAFGGQPAAGLLVDRLGRPRAAALAGLLLGGAALLLVRWPFIAVTLAGVGSAMFHVGGGALALCATQGRAVGPGLFAAPGVAGLAIGGVLAATNHFVTWPFLVLSTSLGVAIACLELPPLPYPRRRDEPVFETHDLVMLTLLTAIALRSAVWNTFQLLLAGNLALLFGVGLAAAIGKALGGLLADWLGWRRWTVGALLAAAALLTFADERPAALLVGVALLQSATPAALAATGQMLPRQPATAAGLALGLAIVLGGLPFVGGLGQTMNAPPVVALLTILAAIGFWIAARPAQAMLRSSSG